MQKYSILSVETVRDKQYRHPVGILLEDEVDGQRRLKIKLYMYPNTTFQIREDLE